MDLSDSSLVLWFLWVVLLALWLVFWSLELDWVDFVRCEVIILHYYITIYTHLLAYATID